MENLNAATVGNRFVAYLIDGIIVSVATYLISAVFGGAMFAGMSDNPDAGLIALGGAAVMSNLISLVLMVAYFTYFEAKETSTIGKKVMKIRTINEDGTTLTTSQSLIRALMKLVSGMICLIGFLMVFFTNDKKTLHDMVSKTNVVRTDV